MSFISLIAFFAYLFAGVYVFLEDIKSKVNQLFLVLSIAFAVYALSYVFIYLSPTKEFALTWFKVSSIGWTIFPAILLNFSLTLTGNDKKIHSLIIQPLIFLPGVIFLFRSFIYQLYAQDFIWNSLFWKFVPAFESPWLWLFIIYISAYVLFSAILIFRWKTSSALVKFRKQAGVILSVIILGFVLSLTSNLILPLVKIHRFPEFAHLACAVMIVGIGFALVRYRHVPLNPANSGLDLFPLLTNMVFLTDKNLNIRYVNKACTDSTGYLSEEIHGKSINEFINDPSIGDDKKNLLKKGSWPMVSNVKIRTRKGEPIPCVMKWKPTLDDYDDLTGFLFVAKDISAGIKLSREVEERRGLQYELTKAREQAEESDKLKSTFLSNISHELRTPLNGILGFAEILKLDLQDSKFSEIADHIDRSGNRLLGTLNSIIDLSLIETNKKEIDKQPVDISNLVKAKATLYQNYASSKNLYLNTAIGDQKIMSRTDQRLLGHVLSNLLDNAIKYTETGGLEVSCRQISSGNRYWALIRIQDTGIGIEPEDYSKIFERFRQSSEGQNRAYEGMGIGLSICKHFVELLDGEIWVESEIGKGSAFYVKIPSYFTDLAAEKTSGEPTPKDVSPDEAPRGVQHRPCILIVEDERSNREYMKYILSEFYEVDTTESGIQALEMANKNKYDLIFMDVNLNKEMTGIEAMKKIRNINHYANIDITAVTANVLKNTKETLLNSGFSHYLSKPFSRDQLLNMTRKIFEEA